jgi:heme A synthase
MDLLLIVVLQGVVFGGGCAILASNKKRHVAGWFVLGFLFSLIALIVIAALTPLDNVKSLEDVKDKRDRPGHVHDASDRRQKAADLAASLRQSKARLDS